MMSSKTFFVAVLLASLLVLGVFSQDQPTSSPTDLPSSDPSGPSGPGPQPPAVAPVNPPVVAPVVAPAKAPANQTNPTNPTNPTKPSGPIVDEKTLGWIEYGVLGATILIGLVWCVAGYRLLKPVLFFAGFTLFYFVAYNILASHTTLQTWINMAIAAGAGILGGIVLVLVFKVGVFLMGFIFGAVLATLIVAFTPLNGLILTSVASNVSFWVFLACIVGLGVLVGIAAVIFTRPIFIFVTAWNGAYLIVASIDKLTHWNRLAVLANIFSGAAYRQVILGWKDYQTYVIFGGLVILAIGGIVIQAKFTAKGHHHDPAVMDRKPKGQDDIPLLEP